MDMLFLVSKSEVVMMNELIKCIKDLMEEIRKLYNHFFNLLEVLAKKGLLTAEEVDYIRYKGEKDVRN